MLNCRKALWGLGLWMVVLVSPAQTTSLEGLAKLKPYSAARVSSGNPNDNADSIPQLAPGAEVVLLDVAGPARIVHIWFTAVNQYAAHRACILRMYWDNHPIAAVEVPFGKFFGQGFADPHVLNAAPVMVTSPPGYNCYWPMPFREHARITLTNIGDEPLAGIFYQFDLQRGLPIGEDEAYFCANYRQAVPDLGSQQPVVLEATGEGHFVGMFFGHRSNTPSWWGEGDDLIWIDDDVEPSIVGTGTEDYFGGAWTFLGGGYTTLYNGYLPGQTPDDAENVCYRFHLPDPIPFRRRIKVSFKRGVSRDRSDDHSTVAFWYQRPQPNQPVSVLPPAEQLSGTAAYIQYLTTHQRWPQLLAFYERCIAQTHAVEFRSRMQFQYAATLVEQGSTEAGLTQFRRLAPGPFAVLGDTAKIIEYLQQHGIPSTDFPSSAPAVLRCHPAWLESASAAGRTGYRLRPTHEELQIALATSERGPHPRERLEIDCYNAGAQPISLAVMYRVLRPGMGESSIGSETHTVVPPGPAWQTASFVLDSLYVTGVDMDLSLKSTDGELLIGGLRLFPAPEPPPRDADE